MLQKGDVKRLDYLKSDCYLEGEYSVEDLQYFLNNSFTQNLNMTEYRGDFKSTCRRELASNFNLQGIIFVDFEQFEIEILQNEMIFKIFQNNDGIWKLEFIDYVTNYQYYK